MIKEVKLLSITLFMLLALTQAFSTCPGKPNEKPIIKTSPKLLNETKNGQKYILEDGDENYIYLAIFKGTPYEVGMAYGELFKEEIMTNFHNINNYVKDNIQKMIKENLPWYLHWLEYMPIIDLFQDALEFEYLDTVFYTPDYIEEEIKGLAKGIGISPGAIKRINLFPELIRASCSIVGAWDKATHDGGLLQVRALDWDDKAPMSKYPLITIYHFNDDESQTFANFGWAGVIGSLAGFSPNVGISEKYGGPDNRKDSSWYGEPWMYVLRDVLQFGKDLENGLSILEKAKKTWKIFVGLGATEDNSFRGIKYSHEGLIIYDDKNYTTPYKNAHPLMEGIVYWDKFMKQPSSDPCLGDILKKGYGNLTSDYLFRNCGMARTGDTLLAVYDYQQQMVHISYSEYDKGVPAFDRSMFELDMEELFKMWM